MKTRWLDRRIGAPGPYLCLCLSQAEYDAARAHCGLRDASDWLKNGHSHATTTHLENGGQLCCIVSMSSTDGRKPIEIAGLLVHEAAHVWQAWCNRFGEHSPGDEQEAYAIQSIAQELMAEYARRLDEAPA